MPLKPVNIYDMPKAAQRGITFWILAWVCLLANFYWLTGDKGWVSKLAIAVGLLTYFLFAAQNWSRMISLMASAMAVFFSAILAYAMREELGPLMLSVAGLILFGLTINYLINKTTAAFFKAQSKPEIKEDTDSPDN